MFSDYVVVEYGEYYAKNDRSSNSGIIRIDSYNMLNDNEILSIAECFMEHEYGRKFSDTDLTKLSELREIKQRWRVCRKASIEEIQKETIIGVVSAISEKVTVEVNENINIA